MATTTTNLGLTKPALGEKMDIAVVNTNMDLIDSGTVLKAGTSQGIGKIPKVVGNAVNGESYIQVMNNVDARMGFIGYGAVGAPFSITDEANQGISLVSPSGNIKVNGNSISFSYNFGIFTSADITALHAAIIDKFNGCDIGCHSYFGVWSGNWYFGGTIHKFANNLGVMTFYPTVPSTTQSSLNIYNAGAGWYSTAI